MVLRELFVKLGLDVDEASFAKGQIAAGIVVAGLHKLVEVGAEAVHAFLENTEAAIEYGDKIKKTSQSVGIATDALQELQYAGSLADLSAQEMSQSIGILSRKMLEAKQGSAEAGKAFHGIAFQEGGKLKATDEVLGSIADKFQAMPDGAEKTAMAMQLFGRAGKQMIPLLNKGSAALEETRKEARELGLVMGEDAVEGSEELNDNLKRLHAISQGLWRSAIAPLIPAISDLVKRFLEWRKENGKLIAQKLQVFIGLLVKGVGLLGDAFDFVIKNATAFKILLGTAGLFLVVNQLAAAMGALSIASVGAALATAKAWLIAAAPFIAIGALIAGFLLVFDDIRGYLAGEDSLYGTFKQEIDDWLKPRADDPWFVKALKNFIRYIEEAIEWMKDLDDVFGDGSKARALAERQAGKNKGQIRMDTDAQTIQTARQRVSMGLPLTPTETEALQRGGVSAEAFKKKYSPGSPQEAGAPAAGTGVPVAMPAPEKYTPSAMPEARTPPGGGVMRSSIEAPVQINVTQNAGESGADFANRVTDQITRFWNGQLEAATAGVKR